MSTLKKTVKKFFNTFGFELRQVRPEGTDIYSYQEEEKIISHYLKQLNPTHRCYVDIGASGGVNGSNSYVLAKDNWSGLAVEYDGGEFAKLAYQYREFSNVYLSRCKVTPENVVSLFKGNGIPSDFDFLTLDIDGYDYFVLEQILTEYRPGLICTEINEKIPPPIKFAVKYDPDYAGPRGHLYGQSLSQLHILCDRHDYALVQLEYNNAFLIPKEKSPSPALSPEEAYREGYLDRSDRRQKYPWNADMEAIYSLSGQQAVDFVKEKFAEYDSAYICEL